MESFISLFAGIGGFDRGLEAAGMKCVGQVERDKDCLRILERHWPGKERCTDVKEVTKSTFFVRPQLVCGGFPCQDVSVAGRRVGLSGERSGLWWEFRRIIAELLPPWVLIENVPGLLSSWTPTTDAPSGVPSRGELGRRIVLDETSDFDTVTRGLAELGYGWAMRVFDAQWHGLAQRRERVLIVGCLGNAARAAEVLFERDCLPWDSTPSREAKPDIAPCVRIGTESGSNEHGNKIAIGIGGEDLSYSITGDGSRFGSGRDSQDSFVVGPLQAHSVEHGHSMTSQQAAESGHLIAHALTAEGHDASEDGTGRGTPLVPVAYMVHGENSCAMTGNGVARVAEPAVIARSLDTTGGFTVQQGGNVIAFDTTQITSPGNYSNPRPGDPCHPLASGAHAPAVVIPIDMRQASRGGTMTNNRTGDSTGGAPGTGIGEDGDPAPTVASSHVPAVAFQERGREGGRSLEFQEELAYSINSKNGGGRTQENCIEHRMGVRRLTPRECERLQGFPDDWTRFDADGKELADSPRFRMLGNAVPPPMVEWIGKRIVADEKSRDEERYWANVAAAVSSGEYLKPGM